MNASIYALCNTKIIGLIIYLSGACLFPPLAQDKPINLLDPKSVLEISINAPVEHDYLIELSLTFPESEREEIEKLLDLQDKSCMDKSNKEPQKEIGATPLHIVVKDEFKKIEHDFYARGTCSISWWSGRRVGRNISLVHLKKGAHTLQINSSKPAKEMLRYQTLVSITAGTGK